MRLRACSVLCCAGSVLALPMQGAGRPLFAMLSCLPTLLLQSMGGRVTPEVVAAVDQELAGLSAAPPTLPWSGGGGRKK